MLGRLSVKPLNEYKKIIWWCSMEFEFFLVGAILGVVLGVFIGIFTDEMLASKIKKQAIKNGLAEYNKTTGKWQWKRTNK